MALTTLTKLEAYLGDIDDTLGNDILNRASSIIESYCQRTFASTTYTNEEYDGTGASTLNLLQYPITAFTSLDVRTSPLNENSWDTIDTERYFYYSDNGIVKFADGSLFHDIPRHYRATYTAGYSTIPDDLQEACLKLAVNLYQQKNAASGVQSEAIGDYNITYNTSSQTIKSLGLEFILDKYRKSFLE